MTIYIKLLSNSEDYIFDYYGLFLRTDEFLCNLEAKKRTKENINYWDTYRICQRNGKFYNGIFYGKSVDTYCYNFMHLEEIGRYIMRLYTEEYNLFPIEERVRVGIAYW